MLVTFTGLKIALATAVGSLALGGAAAAATGSLPGQAHFDDQSSPSSTGLPFDTASATASASSSATATDSLTADPSDTGTPSATASAGTSSTSSHGPDAQGPAAWGLCHAFGNKTWGNLNAQPTGTPNPAGRKPGNPSVAYANLVATAAAHGLTVDQYCTVVLANHGAPPTISGTPSAPGAATTTGHGHNHGHSHGPGKGKGKGHKS